MTRSEIEELIYGRTDKQRRFTLDFPILPDVWIAYAEEPNKPVQLLLTPHTRSDTAMLARALRSRLKQELPLIQSYRERKLPGARNVRSTPRIIFNESVVFADFTFEELVRVAMPLTDWWKDNVADSDAVLDPPWTKDDVLEFVQKLNDANGRLLKKLIAIAGAIEYERYETKEAAEKLGAEKKTAKKQPDEILNAEREEAFSNLLEGLTTPMDKRGLLYAISRNREAKTGIWRSRMAVKADAAARLFEVDTKGICWAVLDVGIDAQHEAFARRKNKEIVTEMEFDENGKLQFPSRIVRTYDFLRVKNLLDPTTSPPLEGSYAETMDPQERDDLIAELQHNLDSGRALNWDLLEPFLRVPHVDPHVGPQYSAYRKSLADSHGTHVAGIIAANWPEASKNKSLKQELYGVCPEVEVYDLRVLGQDGRGNNGDEFTIIAALQFVRHLNAHRDLMLVHGVNLSMAVVHDVANYGCGRTPICEECERVVASGMVAVTAAGNRGFNKLANPEDGSMGDYRYISITDPGNAQSVITVGSTHRFMPHNYGVSYFSSRGPTGDGRTKPDLVAPGERIDSCSPGNNFETMDGTSMAAPHVSGAAILLMARHRELLGQPMRIKEILCKSATDLGREPRFQGAGMVDVLRALQCV